MEIKSEYHQTQKSLFRRVNQIRRSNGICDFEEHKTGYRLHYHYREETENDFVVLKGKDGLPFKLYDGQEGSAFSLNKGDVLVYECESNNKVWFSYAKWLTGIDTADDEQMLGYTNYGPVRDMMQDGLIAKLQNMKGQPIEPEIVKKEEPQPEPKMIQEPCDGVTGVFDALDHLLNGINLHSILQDIEHINGFSNKKDIDRIQTHKVMHRPGWACRDAPQLRFGGHWMKRAGFDIGQEIKIITINGMILIVPIHPPAIPYEGEPEYQQPFLGG